MAAKRRSTKSRARKVTKAARKTARRPRRSSRSRRRSGLAAMSLDALIRVREEAERLIRTRASAERKALEKQLLQLGGYLAKRSGRR
jgi:hypothetical protein